MNMTEEGKQQIILPQQFVADIRTIIDGARQTAVRSVDFCRVQMYWQLGRRIFEEEQQGKDRADYGTYLIENLAKQLEALYGSGLGRRQLERSRLFYRTYPIASALRTQLNWMQYKLLISIQDESKREYYEHEAVNNAWTGRELERQIYSQLVSVELAHPTAAEGRSGKCQATLCVETEIDRKNRTILV